MSTFRNRGTGGKAADPAIPNPSSVLAAGTSDGAKDSWDVRQGVIAVLMMKERRPTFRMIEGWARSVLLDAGAIRECEEHGWMRDRSDPHARERALLSSCAFT
jgi:hypothetical protein